MTTINQLAEVSSLTNGDAVLIYSANNGDARKVSLTTLSAFLASQGAVGDGKITQYAAPNASGASITLPANSQSTWLVVTPAASYAAMSITLPPASFAVHNQEVMVNCTQAVTALTINAEGATVVGGPTALTANGYFMLRFEGVLKRWYRVSGGA